MTLYMGHRFMQKLATTKIYTRCMHIYTRYKNIFNEKRHYDSTKKECNKKSVRLADQLHFIG